MRRPLTGVILLTTALLAQMSCSLMRGQSSDNPVFAKLRAASAESPLVVAHRGSSSTHPENTVAAFEAAVAAKADVVEFDVYQTSDGEWVCFHDDTCNRTTNAVLKFGLKNAKIEDLTLAQVRALDAGSWFHADFAGERVPTLAEALAAILPMAVPMIERKGGDAEALANELRQLEMVDRVMVQAFEWQWLEAVHAAEPKLLLGALGGRALSAETHEDVARTGASIVHWSAKDLTVDTAAAVRRAGRLLCAYTVNPDAGMLGAAAIGCDLITTDRPARLVELRRRGLLKSKLRTR